MKVLILAPFAAAIMSSIIWSEDVDRTLTEGDVWGRALVVWILMFVVVT